MLKNENIICISHIEWDTPTPIVMHQMMIRLAQHNRVLFVDPPVSYSNLVTSPALWRHHWRKTSLWVQGVHKITDNLYVYYPPPFILEFGHSTAIDKLHQALTASAIKKVAKQLALESAILWLYHPYAIMPRGQFAAKALCYDCNDDISTFFCQNFDKRKKLMAMEQALVEQAHVVFTTSHYLLQRWEKHNRNTHYLPSGVDTALFQQALSPAIEVAPELAQLPAPRIGFVGAMGNMKMNWEWIRAAAVVHPEWSFVFIGPCVDPPPNAITAHKNVTFLGPRPMDALPAYIKGLHVCLIPYQGDEFLKACQPTKTFEYLAAGKPVVASWIPELEAYQPVVRLSHNAEEFIRQIEAALVDGQKSQMIEAYTRVAHGWTWEDRVEKASQCLATSV